MADHERVTRRPASSTAFSRRGLHGRLVDSLGRRVVSGQIPSGEIIDGEAIADEFEVSRTVVREAIKVLSAKGLVDARPRLGTYVRDRMHWNLLDSDVMVWRGETENPDLRLVVELGEVRAIVEPGAARLAAIRRTDEDLALILSALVGMEQSADFMLLETIEADIDFHLAVLAAARNELMERFEVMLIPALRARNTVTLRHDHGKEYLQMHRKVYQYIDKSDPVGAEHAMRELLTRANEDTEHVLRLDATS